MMPRPKPNARPRRGKPIDLAEAQELLEVRLGAGPMSMRRGEGKFYDPVTGRWVKRERTEDEPRVDRPPVPA